MIRAHPATFVLMDRSRRATRGGAAASAADSSIYV
eukprot:SAG11_NODE_21354_length_427_cov_0.576220_1_plen_34_part_01